MNPLGTLTISDIEHLHYDLDDGSVMADIQFPKGRKISIAAAIELVSILAASRSSALNQVVDQQLSGCEVWSLFKRLRTGQTNRASSENTVIVRIPHAFNDVWTAAEMKRFEERLTDSRFPKDLSRSITGAVFELIDNIWVHSSAIEESLFCYRVQHRKLAFGIADMGVGVLRTLRQNKRFSHIKTSMAALEEAVKRGVSGRVDGSGLGLDELTRALASLWGRTRLRSGQAALTFNREQEMNKQIKQFLPEMAGFQISAICRLDSPK